MAARYGRRASSFPLFFCFYQDGYYDLGASDAKVSRKMIKKGPRIKTGAFFLFRNNVLLMGEEKIMLIIIFAVTLLLVLVCAGAMVYAIGSLIPQLIKDKKI